MSPFEALVQAIVYQQLAGAAARAIHGRLIAALPGGVEPEALLALTDDTLRAVGLSGAKVRSLRDLATKVLEGTVVIAPRRLARLSDDQITERLVTVRGIGRWTAEMFLMFQLGGSTCGRRATSASAGAIGSHGRSPRRPPASSSRSAIGSGPTGPWSPGTAGAPRAVRRGGRERCDRLTEPFDATARSADLALDWKAGAGIRTGILHVAEADAPESRSTRL